MISSSNIICKYYLNGACKYNESECRFSHIRTDIIKDSSHTEKMSSEELSKDCKLQTDNNNTNQNKSNSRVNQNKSNSRPNQTKSNSITYQNKSNYTYIKRDNYKKGNRDNLRDEYVIKGKNTETFEPFYQPTDMRVTICNNQTAYNKFIQSNDVIIVPNLFGEENDLSTFHKLLKEMDDSGIPNGDLWKLWHGDSHLIADDSLKFKDKCPTFQKIIQMISDYFHMDIKATRFNYYRDDKDHKPFHHDAAAVKPNKAHIQNFTVGVSFGATRDIAFEDAKEEKGHRRIISFPLPNGYTYAFTKDINLHWRHGIPQIPVEKQSSQPRISIIAWGKVNLIDTSSHN